MTTCENCKTKEHPQTGGTTDYGDYITPFVPAPGLDNDLPNLLEYRPPPIHCLPTLLREYVSQSAEAIGCDPSLVAMPMLAAVAAAIGDSHALLLKTGWIELPVVWTLAIASSGTMKTPAMKAAMEGTEAAQRAAFGIFQSEQTIYKAALVDWQREKNPATAEPIAPKLKSYCIGDATLQAVARRLRDNPRGLLQRRDELSGWLRSLGPYKDGSDAAQWLEFHSAGTLKIDRVDQNKETFLVPRALVSVTGTIQPQVLKKLLTGNDGQHFENGLAPRFLMAMPPERERKWREAVIPDELLKRYVGLFKTLFALHPHIDSETGSRNPRLVCLSAEARNLFIEFVNRNGRELGAFNDERLKSAWSKLEAQAARLALIFHVVRDTCLSSFGDHSGHTIPRDTMEAAVIWTEWIKSETRRIYFMFSNESETRHVDRLIRFARRNGGQCTVAQAAKNGAGGNTSAEVENLMKSLVAAGLAQWQTPVRPNGGRPTRYFCFRDFSPAGGEIQSTPETRETT